MEPKEIDKLIKKSFSESNLINPSKKEPTRFIKMRIPKPYKKSIDITPVFNLPPKPKPSLPIIQLKPMTDIKLF